MVELSCFTDDAFITRCRVSVTDFVAPECTALTQWLNCSYNYGRMHCACMKRPYVYCRSLIWRHQRVSRPRFPIARETFGDSRTFKDDYLIFAWIFMTSWPKMRVGGQNRGRGGTIVTPTNSLLLLGFFTSVPILVKIDREMRPWECQQTDTCYMGQIIIIL